ncbi:serine hydrolase domain-containing protein [Gemmatimonadota bacterium]
MTRYPFILVSLLVGCTTASPTGPDLIWGVSYDWEISTPQEQGVDSSILGNAFTETKKNPFMYSLLVVRNGYLIAEEYYRGRSRNTLDALYSATKSLTSALIGIAIERGYIDSLDQKVLDYFPDFDHENLDPRKRDITIRHLLTMQAGFDHEANIREEVDQASNTMEAIFNSDLRFDPGTDFLYSTHGSHLLSGIISRATSMSTSEFARQNLFHHLGIRSIMWPVDRNGIALGGAGLFMTPRDMARFGYLFLESGSLGPAEIISEGWVDLSVQNHRSYTEQWNEMADVGYGFQWWTGRLGQYPVHFASGYGGQWILIVPDLEMVVVTTMDGRTESNGMQMESIIPIVAEYILPAAALSRSVLSPPL